MKVRDRGGARAFPRWFEYLWQDFPPVIRAQPFVYMAWADEWKEAAPPALIRVRPRGPALVAIDGYTWGDRPLDRDDMVTGAQLRYSTPDGVPLLQSEAAELHWPLETLACVIPPGHALISLGTGGGELWE